MNLSERSVDKELFSRVYEGKYAFAKLKCQFYKLCFVFS